MTAAAELCSAAFDGDLCRLRQLLDGLTPAEIKDRVEARINGTTPLVESCFNGHRRVVEFLVDCCMADVNQRGTVYRGDEVTALYVCTSGMTLTVSLSAKEIRDRGMRK